MRRARGLSRRRVISPTVLQYEAVECGAASLKIVLGYLGRVLPLSDLRERCGISRDGVTALQLKAAAESLELTVNAYRCSAEHLRRAGQFPCILFWTFNHFLVLEGFAHGKVWLSDPAAGRRWVSWRQFQAGFTGVVLELHPGEGFSPGGREPGLYHRVPALLAPYRLLLPWIVLAAVAAALPELFVAGATGQLIDAVLQDGRQTLGIPLLWISSLAVAVLVTLLQVQNLLLRRLGQQLHHRLSGLLFISLFSLPYRVVLQRLRGELATRLLLPFALVQLGIGGVVTVLLTLVSGLVALLVGLFIAPWLALTTLTIAGCSTAVTLWIRSRRCDANTRLALVQGRSIGVGIDVVQRIEDLKANGLETTAFRQWSAGFIDGLSDLQQQGLASALVGLIGSSSGFVLRCSVILVGGLLILQGQLTLGELTAFQFLMGLIQAPLQQLSQLTSQLQQLDGQLGRLNDVVDAEPDPTVRSLQLTKPGEPERRLAGGVELRDLGFRFSRNTPPLFGGLDLTLKPGQHLAIVGPSGSGKSTLLRLLAGLMQPSRGTVLYDGRPWLAWDDPTLRASIALVCQEVFVFEASLEDNLTLWDPSYGPGQVLNALDQVGLLQELGGAGALGLQLGQAGVNLSGGQRQRIEIARALLRRPSLLLLDEGTSALDGEGERQILGVLKQTPRTLITVAHRMRAAQISDQVVVLDQGRPVQQGSPQQLAARHGPYRRLLEAEGLIATGCSNALEPVDP
jgi:ABC-type bacteriocin/lantibiotic exporter with double-glycine peptidase domain